MSFVHVKCLSVIQCKMEGDTSVKFHGNVRKNLMRFVADESEVAILVKLKTKRMKV